MLVWSISVCYGWLVSVGAWEAWRPGRPGSGHLALGTLTLATANGLMV